MADLPQETYLYKIRLYEQFRHKSFWGAEQEAIQQAHGAYIAELQAAGKLQLAGITDIWQADMTGLVLLSVSTYEEANEIARTTRL